VKTKKAIKKAAPKEEIKKGPTKLPQVEKDWKVFYIIVIWFHCCSFSNLSKFNRAPILSLFQQHFGQITSSPSSLSTTLPN
jgi:hypothetical protein